MRAVVVDDWKPFDELEIREAPPPETGPRHVRISGRACGVSFAMSLVVEGRYQRRPPRPFVPGSEYAGVVTEVGSEVTRFRPGDRVLAVTSHLPHAIAYTMVGVADDLATVTEGEVVQYSASGFRDFTRIAASDPVMWRDVFLANREAILEGLGRFAEELLSLQRAIRWGDGDTLEQYFRRGQNIRRSIVDTGQDTEGSAFFLSRTPPRAPDAADD